MIEFDLIDKLNNEKTLSKDEWITLISSQDTSVYKYSADIAREITDKIFEHKIYLRALIEISNICKNNCFYCGIRCGNNKVSRYRMTEQEILESCRSGYNAGYRTFVLQGGEDNAFSDDVLCRIISEIRQGFPKCAITISLGERSYASYKKIKEAGADRYLLRHETASDAHYSKLHPPEMSLKNRFECLSSLKSLGFQTGCGMMVGSPYQTNDNLADDMLFMQKFKPHMIGMGPFIPAANTPFESESAGSLSKTIFLLSLCRIMLPNVLLPATTALATLDPAGREKAIAAGANVVMPNISPSANRKNYLLYDNKAGIADNLEQSRNKVMAMLRKIGYTASESRGDYKSL